MRPQDPLPMWCIYDHPKDYPDKFVVRMFYIYPGCVLPTEHIKTADTLEQVRTLLPRGLQRIPRDPDDAQQIVESWV